MFAEWMRSAADSVVYIKRLIWFLLVLVMVVTNYYPPAISKAEAPGIEVEQEFDGNLIQNDVIIKPNIPTTDEEVASARAYDAEQKRIAEQRRIAANKAANLASNQKSYGRWECVRFVKDLLGIYGTWGNGARKLSHNSTGQIGDVAIFAGYVHAGLVIGREGDQVTIREWMTTKVGAYEQVRTLSVNSFLGFHKF